MNVKFIPKLGDIWQNIANFGENLEKQTFLKLRETPSTLAS